jgi:hypothetical protein
MRMTPTLTIDRRFNGPPSSGNGGYVAGALAAQLGAPSVQVTLRAPMPLDAALQVRRNGPQSCSLHDGDTLLAEAVAQHFDLSVPQPPSLTEAASAGALGRMTARARTGDPYDHCFGCGIARHDGLRIIPSAVGDDGRVAADWTPEASLGLTPEGHLPIEIVWAALDCPAGYAWSNRLPDGPQMMTGRMSAAIDAPLRPGERYIVVGWPIAQDGRKLHAGTAIFDAQGRLLARSLQLWLQLRS